MHLFLSLSATQENIISYGILYFVIFGIVFYFLIKREVAKKEVNDVAKAVDEKLMPEYEAIKQVEKTIIKAISENNDDPKLLFFLNAILKNFSIKEHKRLLIKRTYLSEYVSYNTDAIAKHNKKAIADLYNTQSPVYTNFATIVEKETLEIYHRLSNLYSSLQLHYKEPIENKYKVDWGNGFFYYVKVNDCKIPYFISEENQQIYIYPTALIVYSDNVEFDFIPLANMTVEYKLVENANPKVALMSIKDANLEFTTTKVDEAEKFYNELVGLQQHLSKQKLLTRLETDESSKISEIPNILYEVKQLVGLERVKEDFMTIANYIKVQQVRRLKGMKVQTISYHYVFTGNPGTGKTTIARMLAKVYKELGVVNKGHLVEVDRSKLVGEYVGQTAVKTSNVIDEALDGVLFIDEAYSLTQGGKDDFGAEAISTLLKRMEDDRDRLVVVLAGYGEEMKDFINSNPGLQSRFTRYLHFEDYSAQELREIFDRLLDVNDYTLTPEAGKLLDNTLSNAVANKNKNFGNARFARNLFEETCERQASRLSNEISLNEDQLRTIEAIDIPIK